MIPSLSIMQYKPFGTLLVATTIYCIAACDERAINGLYGVVMIVFGKRILMLDGDDLFMSSILVKTQTPPTIIFRNPSTHHSTTRTWSVKRTLMRPVPTPRREKVESTKKLDNRK